MAIGDWSGIYQAGKGLLDSQMQNTQLGVQATQANMNRAAQMAMASDQLASNERMQTQRLNQDQQQFDMSYGLQKRAYDLEHAMKTEGFKAQVIGSVAQNPSADSYKQALGTLNKLGVDTSDAPKYFGRDAMDFINAKSMESGQTLKLMAAERQQTALDLQKVQLAANIEKQRFDMGMSEAKFGRDSMMQQAQIGYLQAKTDEIYDPTLRPARGNGSNIPTIGVNVRADGTPIGKDESRRYQKELEENTASGKVGAEIITKSKVLENLIQQYEGLQGPGGNKALLGHQILGALGNERSSKIAELGASIKSMTNEIALTMRKEMPGQLSDKDVKFLLEMAPGLENTKEGSLLILAKNKAMGSVRLAESQFKQAYFKKNGTTDGVDSAFKSFLDENPIMRINSEGRVLPREVNADDAVKYATQYSPNHKKTYAPDSLDGLAVSKGYSPEQVTQAIAKYGMEKTIEMLRR